MRILALRKPKAPPEPSAAAALEVFVRNFESMPVSVGINNFPDSIKNVYLIGLETTGLNEKAGLVPQVTPEALLRLFAAREKDKARKREMIRRFLEAIEDFYKAFFRLSLSLKAVEIALPKAIAVVDKVIKKLEKAPDSGSKTIALKEARAEKTALIKLKDEKLPEYQQKLKKKPPVDVNEIEEIESEIEEQVEKNRIFGRIYDAAISTSKYMTGAAYAAAQALKKVLKKNPTEYMNLSNDTNLQPGVRRNSYIDKAYSDALNRIHDTADDDDEDDGDTDSERDREPESLYEEEPEPTGP